MTLTTEDEYAAALRSSLRLDDLHSAAQPEQVLLTSRRAQRRRALRASAAVLCGAVALGFAGPVLVQDARRATDASPATRPEDGEVVVDMTDGTITLPLDRYFLSETEQAEVAHASALAMRACAADRGYEVTDRVSEWLLRPPSPRPNPIGDRRFGVWWMPSAETYGYGVWGTHPHTYGVSKRALDPSRTAVQQEILDECGQTPAVQQLWPDTALREPLPDFQQQTLDSSAGQAAVGEWDACLGAHGLQHYPQGGRWDVTDGKRRSGSTPVEAGEPLGPDSAVIDARCKDDVDLIDRLTHMVADRQAPYIAAHRSELTAIRDALDDSLQRARTYADQHE
jgi:hypothetical protein